MRRTLCQVTMIIGLGLGAAVLVPAQPSTDADHDAKTYNDFGVGQIEIRNYASAIEALNKAIQLSPTDAKAHYNLGSAYYFNKQYDQALVHLQRAIDLDPQYASAYNQIGVVYSDIRQYDQAVSSF